MILPILIPVSAGELVDKITILRVKAARIEAAKRANVVKELALLEAVAATELAEVHDLAELAAELEAVNARLWDIEEAKRDCERRQDFGSAFIDVARAVYIQNDRRAAIKRRINAAAGSELARAERTTSKALAPPIRPSKGISADFSPPVAERYATSTGSAC